MESCKFEYEAYAAIKWIPVISVLTQDQCSIIQFLKGTWQYLIFQVSKFLMLAIMMLGDKDHREQRHILQVTAWNMNTK